MSQGLPNQTDSDGTQGASSSATTLESQESASGNATAILGGATGFAKLLQQDERLIGGILISIPVVLVTTIPFIPAEQRSTLVCLTLGSVLIVALLILLLIKYIKKRDKEDILRNRELQSVNSALEKSKLELEDQLKTLRNVLRDSTRKRRSLPIQVKRSNQPNLRAG